MRIGEIEFGKCDGKGDLFSGNGIAIPVGPLEIKKEIRYESRREFPVFYFR